MRSAFNGGAPPYSPADVVDYSRLIGEDEAGTLALPDEVEQWSLTTLCEKLVKIGAKVVRHGRYVTFQHAEIAIPRRLFAEILRMIDGLRPKAAPT